MAIISSSGTWSVGNNWPWPQIFFLRSYILAVAIDGTDLKLYELSFSSGLWNAIEIITLGPLANIVTVDIADFGNYYAVTTFGYLYYGPLAMPWGVFDEPFEQKSTPMKMLYTRNPYAAAGANAVSAVGSDQVPYGSTCCNYKGQLIIGGLKSNSSIWSTLGQCSIAWSGIRNRLFNPSLDTSAGFIKIPWGTLNQGIIYKVKRLGDFIRVYGNGGVVDLVPVNDDHAVTFGLGDGKRGVMDTIPVLSHDSVAGNNLVHLFIDKEYNLYLSTVDGIRKLGYKNYISNLTNGRLLVRYEENKKRFYISDGTYGFVFNEFGLYSTHQCMTSVGRFDNILTGFVKENSDTKIRLASTSFDIGQQGLKTVESIEYGVNYSTSGDYPLETSISGKYDYKGSFVDLGWVRLNERGIGTNKITAREIKVKVRSTYEDGATFNLSSIKIKFKSSDKRNIRGRLYVA